MENIPNKIYENLRPYQKNIADNIKSIYKRRTYNRFAGTVSPTGSGKSFIGMNQIIETANKYGNDAEMLYIAPTKEILYQIKEHILNNIVAEQYSPDEAKEILKKAKSKKVSNIDNIEEDFLSSLNEFQKDYLIKTIFPNLIFKCYANKSKTIDDIDIKGIKSPKLIILDEAHRAGANVWGENIKNLLENSKDSKVLAITATPERANGTDMMSKLAEMIYGKKVPQNKYMAGEIYLEDAIKLGIVNEPEIVEYNGFLADFENSKMPYGMAVQEWLSQSIKKGWKKNFYSKFGREVSLEEMNDIVKRNPEYTNDSDFDIVDTSLRKMEQAIGINTEDLRENLREKMYKCENKKTKGKFFEENIISKDVIEEENRLIQEFKEKLKERVKQEQEKQIIETFKKNLDEEDEKLRMNPNGKYIAFIPSWSKSKTNIESRGEFFLEWQKKLESYFPGRKVNITFISSQADNKTKNGCNGKLSIDENQNISFSDNKDSNKTLNDFNNLSSKPCKNDKDNVIKIIVTQGMLDEGVHVNGIDGVMMFDKISENGTRRFMQQIGRGVYSLDPEKPKNEQKHTKVFDFVGNNYNQSLYRDQREPYSFQLQELESIKEWIDENERYPKVYDNLSSDIEKMKETNYAGYLRYIQIKSRLYKNGIGYKPEDKKTVKKIIKLVDELGLDDKILRTETDKKQTGIMRLTKKQREFRTEYYKINKVKNKKEIYSKKAKRLIDALKILKTVSPKVKLPSGIISPGVSTYSYGESFLHYPSTNDLKNTNLGSGNLLKFLNDNYDEEQTQIILDEFSRIEGLQEVAFSPREYNLTRELAIFRGKYFTSQYDKKSIFKNEKNKLKLDDAIKLGILDLDDEQLRQDISEIFEYGTTKSLGKIYDILPDGRIKMKSKNTRSLKSNLPFGIYDDTSEERFDKLSKKEKKENKQQAEYLKEKDKVNKIKGKYGKELEYTKDFLNYIFLGRGHDINEFIQREKTRNLDITEEQIEDKMKNNIKTTFISGWVKHPGILDRDDSFYGLYNVLLYVGNSEKIPEEEINRRKKVKQERIHQLFDYVPEVRECFRERLERNMEKIAELKEKTKDTNSDKEVVETNSEIKRIKRENKKINKILGSEEEER